MRVGARRWLGAGAAAALLIAAGLFHQQLSQRRESDEASALAARASQSVIRAQELLQASLRRLQQRAKAASAVHELRMQIGVVDANTLRDGFATEPWWGPVRREAPVSALAITGEEVDVALGIKERSLEAGPLIRQARQDRQTLGAVSALGAPYLAAATVVDKPGRWPQPVLILAQPINEELLAQLVRAAGGPVMLSEGRRTVVATGGPEERFRFDSAAATQDPQLHGPGWAARAAPLGGNLRVWAYASAGPAAGASAAALTGWGVAGAGALLALFFGFRRPGNDDIAGEEALDLEPAEAEDTPHSFAAGATGPEMPARPPSPASGPPPSSGSDPRLPATQPSVIGSHSFGRYTLLDRLGEGGMADVYTAVAHGAQGFRRNFVVKRLRAGVPPRQDLIDMFIDEARLGSSLVHSNIIPVFDFGEVSGEYYMATEYILGRDLGKVTERSIEKEGRGIPPDVAMYCAAEVLEALDYAHTLHDEDGRPMGLVHRDVSPNNILVSLRGEVKLFDFGIAKAEGRRTQTEAGTVKGNCGFMSAEQALGSPVDARSDLCSLGLTLYFALTGQSLYDSASLARLLQAVSAGPTEREWNRVSRLPTGVREVVWTSIQADPAKRYRSAAEMLIAIGKLPRANAHAVSKLMERLFGPDLKAEHDRFRNAKTGSSGSTPTPRSSADGGS